jgi:hypothetical protein
MTALQRFYFAPITQLYDALFNLQVDLESYDKRVFLFYDCHSAFLKAV